MSCSRCGGLMPPIGLMHYQWMYEPCPAFRCLACGHVTDGLMVTHHQGTKSTDKYKLRAAARMNSD
jgi:hypothetical protein